MQPRQRDKVLSGPHVPRMLQEATENKEAYKTHIGLIVHETVQSCFWLWTRGMVPLCEKPLYEKQSSREWTCPRPAIATVHSMFIRGTCREF